MSADEDRRLLEVVSRVRDGFELRELRVPEERGLPAFARVLLERLREIEDRLL